MLNRIVLTGIALTIFAAAPALAQCTKEKGTQKKACCAKTQEVKKAQKADAKGCQPSCSKDCKECKIACPGCGKEMTVTLAKDCKSCTGKCEACGKVVKKECTPNHCKDKNVKACCSSKDAKASCCPSKDAKAGSAAQSTLAKAKTDDACHKEEGEDDCGDTNCAGDMVRYKGMPVPRMVYQVGEARMTCAKSSAALASKQNAKIQYVVEGKVYDEKPAALAAYADMLEEFLDEVLTVKHDANVKPACYQLAAFKFECPNSSEQAVKQAREAIGKIEMVVMVGDEKYHCPAEAAQAAKKQGKEVDYSCGKMRTTSETVARIQLATQKIKTAVDTFEKCGGKPI